jgi:hypothetical protein
LKDISDILSRPDYDRRSALEEHRSLLLLKRGHIDTMIALVDKTLRKGDTNMTKKITAADIDAQKVKYAAEAAEKWGKTAAYAESERRYAAYSGEQKVDLFNGAEDIFIAFSALRKDDPASNAAQEIVKRWQSYITGHFYSCTDEILAGLGQMYVANTRFTENIDKYGAGTAEFMSKAITAYCKNS